MNDRQKEALRLRDEGFGPTVIGEKLGISKQAAAGLLARVDSKLLAFANVNPAAKPKNGAGLSADSVVPSGGAKPLGIWSERSEVSDSPFTGWTLSEINKVYNELKAGHDTWRAFSLAEELLERDAHVRSLVNLRSSFIATRRVITDVDRLPLLRDRKRADEFMKQMEAAGLADVRLNTSKVFHYGYAVVGIEWEATATEMRIKQLHWCDPKFFLFDRQNPRKLYIRPDRPGGELKEAPAGQYIVIFSNGKPGTPVRSGLWLPAALPYALKTAREARAAAFLDDYGFPAAAVTLPESMDEVRPTDKEFKAFEKLVRDLGPRGKIVLPHGAKAEYLDHSAVEGTAASFLEYIRFQEEKQSRLYLNGSMNVGTTNTGNGGYAQAKTQDDNGWDLMAIDAVPEASWINEAAYWWSYWNYGPEATAPRYYIDVEKPEDTSKLWDNVGKAQKAGMQVSKSGMGKRGGVPMVEDGDLDDVLEPVKEAPAEQDGDNQAQPGQKPEKAKPAKLAQLAAADQPEGGPDRIDDLVNESDDDWELVTASLQEQLAELVASTPAAELPAKLAAFVEAADVTALTTMLTEQALKTRLAGADATAED